MTAINLHSRPRGFWNSMRQGLPGILTIAALWFGFFSLVAVRVLG